MKISSLIVVLILALSAKITVFAATQDGLKDPTRPLGFIESEQAGPQTEFVLNSVTITGTGRTAVINGQRVDENQMVNGAEVVSIEPGRVVLKVEGRHQELKVHPTRIRTPDNNSRKQ